MGAAFDRLDHQHILESVGTFPARELIARWLKAGVVEDGWPTPTEQGSPQGGVISPALLNIALHGMGKAAGVRYTVCGSNAATVARDSPVVVVYADDLLALCHTREQAEQVKARLAVWLAPRGLRFNEEKTRITHLDQGVDFLGFEVRRFRGKLLTKPSKAALRRIRQRLTAEMLALRGSNAAGVIHRLNPIIAGWAAYYRIGVSKRAFASVDHHLWKLTWKWARYSHPNKLKRWVQARYFGKFNKFRQDTWVFGDRETGFYMRRFVWTPIVRHRMVPGTASVDDSALTEFWAKRRRRNKPPLDTVTLRQLRVQSGRCPLCGDLLLHADHEPQSPQEWEQWLKATRKATRRQAINFNAGSGMSGNTATQHLIHTSCLSRHNRYSGSWPALHAASSQGFA